MANRPSMHARDSSGNKVSLLNDDPTPRNAKISTTLAFRYPIYGQSAVSDHPDMVRSYSDRSVQSQMSSPRTPGLQRSDSYDSNTTGDLISPSTPVGSGEFGRQSSYTNTRHSNEPKYEHRSSYEYSMQNYHLATHLPIPSMLPELQRRQSSFSDHHSYDEDYANGGNSEGRTKRYPCRFRDSHSCEKTFTTSGHASRHSKIHTAEKAVNCTFPGCHKKFTRADNMKQHLETHNKNSKDRCSNTASRVQNSSTPKGLTRPAGVSKSMPRPVSSNDMRPEEPYHGYGVDRYTMSAQSPTHQYHPTPRPMTASSSGGLDALAAVAAAQ